MLVHEVLWYRIKQTPFRGCAWMVFCSSTDHNIVYAHNDWYTVGRGFPISHIAELALRKMVCAVLAGVCCASLLPGTQYQVQGLSYIQSCSMV